MHPACYVASIWSCSQQVPTQRLAGVTLYKFSKTSDIVYGPDHGRTESRAWLLSDYNDVSLGFHTFSRLWAYRLRECLILLTKDWYSTLDTTHGRVSSHNRGKARVSHWWDLGATSTIAINCWESDSIHLVSRARKGTAIFLSASTSLAVSRD